MMTQALSTYAQQILKTWVEEEHRNLDYRDLENQLGLSYGKIDWWRMGLASSIRIKELEALASYRNCTVEQVQEWLGLSSVQSPVAVR